MIDMSIIVAFTKKQHKKYSIHDRLAAEWCYQLAMQLIYFLKAKIPLSRLK
jgi:hypothetical protein